jgi:hypothetical protein
MVDFKKASKRLLASKIWRVLGEWCTSQKAPKLSEFWKEARRAPNEGQKGLRTAGRVARASRLLTSRLQN